MSTTRTSGDKWSMYRLLKSIVLSVVAIVRVEARLWNSVHVRLRVWLALVAVGHPLWISKLSLLMHSSGGHGGAAILSVWRILLHDTLRLECRWHAATTATWVLMGH